MANMLVCHETYGDETVKTYLKRPENDNLIIINTSKRWAPLKQTIMAVFLPAGFPESVSEDYIVYQIWDTIQAFASSINGTLTTQAILKGIGVGDESATPLSATITWLLKDGTGMLGRITFAWLEGSSLDCDSKKWRLFADVLNDVAMCLDLLAPYFQNSFTFIVCISGLMKSLVGVAGGATRAALTQHQARRNNLADVAAKDGSQETLVNLAALICSLIMIPVISGNQTLVWTLYFIFTVVHLFANYLAVSCLVMETLNQTRYHTLIKHFLRNGEVLSPQQANSKEPFIKGIKRPLKMMLGCSLSSIVTRYDRLQFLQKLYSGHQYLLDVNLSKGFVGVAYNATSTVADELESFFEAELICFADHLAKNKYQMKQTFPDSLMMLVHAIQLEDINMVVETSRSFTKEMFPRFLKELKQENWVVSHTLLSPDEWRSEWNSHISRELKLH